MPKHKTTYMGWRENATGGTGFPDPYAVICWDVEAWNADHAIRLIRANPDLNVSDGESIAVVPARYFREG